MWEAYIRLNKRRLVKWALALAFFAAGVAVPLLAGEGELSFPAFYGLTALASCLMMVLPALVFITDLFRDIGALRGLFPRADAYRAGLTLLAAVSYTMVGFLVSVLWLAVLHMLGVTPPQQAMLMPSGGAEMLWAVLLVALVPAVSEELLFRGAVLGVIRKRFGEQAGIWLSAGVFALAHLSLAAFPALVLIGAVLAKLAVKFKGLTLPILFHAAYNMSAVAINQSGAAPGLFGLVLSALAFRFAMAGLAKEEG